MPQSLGAGRRTILHSCFLPETTCCWEARLKGSCGDGVQQPSSLLCVQIKRRASEALPELLRPVTPITNFEGTRPQDPSGIFGLVSNLEQLDVDDWEF